MLKRECHLSDQGIEMIETIIILRSFITAEEVKSKEFQNLRQSIKKYCSKIALIISNLPMQDLKKSVDAPLAKGA